MIRTFLNTAILLIMTLAVTGCFDNGTVTPATPEPGMVTFTLSVYAGDPDNDEGRSRVGTLPGDDYFEEAQTKYERMRTLRAIIVRPNGQVEHNVFLSNTIPADGLGEYSYIRLQVIGGEQKKVYLFANEASLPVCGLNDVDLSSFVKDTTFPVDLFSDYTLVAAKGAPIIDNTGTDSSTGTFIPMSEVFDVDILSPDDDPANTEQAAQLFITRAAVKFSFNVSSTEAPVTPYTITELAIDGVGNTEYLIPNATTYVPAKYPPSFSDRYIKEYTVPSSATVSTYSFRPAGMTFDASYVPGTVFTYAPALYFSETAPASGSQYILKVRLDDDEDYCAEVPLPNLPAMPRNTHVKVNISLTKSDVKCTVDVVPYTAVPLNPEFGFDELLPRPVEPGEVPPWLEIDPDEAE